MRASSRSVLQLATNRVDKTSRCTHIISQRSKRNFQRPFHLSIPRRNENDASTKTLSELSTDDSSNEILPPNNTNPDDSIAPAAPSPPNPSIPGIDPSRPKDANNYGSAARRSRRNKTPKEPPVVHLPPWLFTRNIMLADEALHEHVEHESEATKRQEESNAKSKAPDTKACPPTQGENRGLRVPPSIYNEVKHLFKAAIRLRPTSDADMRMRTISHFILCCPKFGASEYLKWLVREQLHSPSTDFLHLNPQDIAFIGGEYLDESTSIQSNTLSSLGYDSSLMPAQRPYQGQGSSSEDQGLEDAEEEDVDAQQDQPSSPRMTPVKGASRVNIGESIGIIPMGSVIGNLQDVFKSLGPFQSLNNPLQPSKTFIPKSSREGRDHNDSSKMEMLVGALLAAPKIKREIQPIAPASEDTSAAEIESSASSTSVTAAASESIEEASRDLVVIIEDYPQINATSIGARFLDKLYDIVSTRRRDGRKILVVGTASTPDSLPSMSKAGVDDVQSESNDGTVRTIVMPVREMSEQVLMKEHKAKMRAINQRHLQDMVRRLAPIPAQVTTFVNKEDLGIKSHTAFLADLDLGVWPIERVNRIASYALGLMGTHTPLFMIDVEHALLGIYEADKKKYEWVKREQTEREKLDKTKKPESQSSDTRMQMLQRTCNNYEKKLLHGVVDADAIKTTFADVRAQPATIDALKTLTSLSLVRPDAFSYGVLASDRIPGLLLYGPPGTGKTLLAKAVAKESGATVLEVSGSDVYNMYVGEGEKNVRAIFSLAKKLAPCIIFIDEADSLLGTRSGTANRASHREIINQFLREWDGMTDLNAFIMVATNRPFDLDEASLRRLPRRLLVDLPVEIDREEILRIHLKQEVLDPEVSLSKLASETPFYSGSDLKNMCVAAALACVREEYDAAVEHDRNLTKDTSESERYKYAEKRVLCMRHFTKGMDEISASVSEDMGSLSAIRKFDEKFGDRKGKRKKLGAYGFKTISEGDLKRSDAARVRNQ